MGAAVGRLDPADPIWASPAPRHALDRHDAGAVIRLARQVAGWTQAELGARCGYSASTISRLERGQPPLHLVDVRRRLAEVLSIPPEHLGLSPTWVQHAADLATITTWTRPDPDRLREPGMSGGGDPMRRRILLGGIAAATVAGVASAAGTAAAAAPTGGLERLLFAATRPVPPLDGQTGSGQVVAASRAYAAGRYTHLTQVLPELLAGLHAAHDAVAGRQRDTVAGLLARAYVLASSLCTKLGDDAIGWVLADRALTAAQTTGDPVVTASAAHTVAIAMRRVGHHAGAISLLTTTASRLGADRGHAPAAVVAAFGNLMCTAAYSAAQAGDTGSATTYLDEAAVAAARLPQASTGVVPFSSSTVATYRIGVHTTLGDTAAALDAARSVTVAALPSPERYGRYCVDTARAWAAHGRPDRAVQALLATERHVPEEVHRPSVRDLVSGLLYAPTATPEGLRGLAGRIGVA